MGSPTPPHPSPEVPRPPDAAQQESGRPADPSGFEVGSDRWWEQLAFLVNPPSGQPRGTEAYAVALEVTRRGSWGPIWTWVRHGEISVVRRVVLEEWLELLAETEGEPLWDEAGIQLALSSLAYGSRKNPSWDVVLMAWLGRWSRAWQLNGFVVSSPDAGPSPERDALTRVPARALAEPLLTAFDLPGRAWRQKAWGSCLLRVLPAAVLGLDATTWPMWVRLICGTTPADWEPIREWRQQLAIAGGAATGAPANGAVSTASAGPDPVAVLRARLAKLAEGDQERSQMERALKARGDWTPEGAAELIKLAHRGALDVWQVCGAIAPLDEAIQRGVAELHPWLLPTDIAQILRLGRDAAGRLSDTAVTAVCAWMEEYGRRNIRETEGQEGGSELLLQLVTSPQLVGHYSRDLVRTLIRDLRPNTRRRLVGTLALVRPSEPVEPDGVGRRPS